MAKKDSTIRQKKANRDCDYIKRRRAEGFVKVKGRWTQGHQHPEPLPGEEWRPVPGYEYRYLASSQGRMYTLRGMGKFLKPYRLNDWYPTVSLSSADGASRTDTLHAWVALTFLGPTPNGLEINHKDGNKGNTRVSNLEFVTHQENVDHAVATGLQNNKGERHGLAVLTESEVHEIRRRYIPGKRGRGSCGYIKLARMFGVSQKNIRAILHGESWGWLPVDAAAEIPA